MNQQVWTLFSRYCPKLITTNFVISSILIFYYFSVDPVPFKRFAIIFPSIFCVINTLLIIRQVHKKDHPPKEMEIKLLFLVLSFTALPFASFNAILQLIQ